MTLYIENAAEGLQGDGVNTFGIADLFGSKGVNANVGFQMDVANFFSGARAVISPSDVQTFFESNVEKIGYIHLKTSINRKAQLFLDGNELPFEVFFDSLSKHGKVYICIEHTNPETLQEAYANHQKSVDYLLKNF